MTKWTAKGKKTLLQEKKISKPRAGRVERLKEAVHLKDEVNQLSLHAMAMKKVATKVVASNRRLKRYVTDIRASAGVSGRWGLSGHSANFFAQLLVGRSSRGVQTPLPFLYAGIEWRASEQLCKGINRVSRTPPHRPDTPALTLYPLVHSKYVYIPLIFIQEIGRN